MVTTTDLISYWKMDESSGDMIDAHGSNDGTVNGATQNVADGILNTCYSFDGSNDEVTVPDDATLDISTNFSAFIWIKNNNAASTNDNDFAFCRWDHNNNRQWAIASNPSGGVRIYLGTSTTVRKQYNTTTDLTDDTWHLIGFTFDSGTLKVYVDGVERTTGDDLVKSTDLSITTIDATNEPLTVGARQRNGNEENFFNSNIDEISFWGRTLSDTDISDLWNSGNGLAYPFSAPSGWSGKIQGISPGKVQSIAVADIGKIQGVS